MANGEMPPRLRSGGLRGQALLLLARMFFFFCHPLPAFEMLRTRWGFLFLSLRVPGRYRITSQDVRVVEE